MKARVLVITEVYLPGHLAGGPVRSIANLVERLGDDIQWSIVTTDRDWRASSSYPDVEVNRWSQVGKARVIYCRPERITSEVVKLATSTSHDVLYLNSFFSPKFSIAMMHARALGVIPRTPVLLAARGEFSTGALQIKQWKKRSYIQWARTSGIYDDAHWHASTALEAEDIASVMRPAAARVHVASDLTAITGPAPESPLRRDGAPLRVCFLSRIARMKNLVFALRTLAEISVPVDFTIYGPKEDPVYWTECQALIAALPPHVTVTVRGSVPNTRVRAELANHDLFFLPTLGENFGHVFLEAWSAGLPVLTSDQTPWRKLAERGVGWDLPLATTRSFAEVIEQLSNASSAELAQLRIRAAAFSKNHSETPEDLMANLNMFTRVAQSSST